MNDLAQVCKLGPNGELMEGSDPRMPDFQLQTQAIATPDALVRIHVHHDSVVSMAFVEVRIDGQLQHETAHGKTGMAAIVMALNRLVGKESRLVGYSMSGSAPNELGLVHPELEHFVRVVVAIREDDNQNIVEAHDLSDDPSLAIAKAYFAALIQPA